MSDSSAAIGSEQSNLQKPAVKPDRITAYEVWRKNEPIRTIEGFFVPDLMTVELDFWPRMQANAAFLELDGIEEGQGTYLCELSGGAQTSVQHHMYEEMLVILSGSGATSVWSEGQSNPTSFEWNKGSIFALPLNSYYQHFNISTEPARFCCITTLPLVMNLFHNEDFIFNNPYVFMDRFNGSLDYFNGEGELSPGRFWETNFLADAYSFPLQVWKERGADSRTILLDMGVGSTLASHISEFDVGTYKKAHRHGPGAHVIILTGHGYSLMWPEGGEKKRFDWGPGSLVVPPEQWNHQHFNTSSEPSRYMALRWAGSRHFPLIKKNYAATVGGVEQIDYEDEDPEIRAKFENELSKRHLKSQMYKFFTPTSVQE